MRKCSEAVDLIENALNDVDDSDAGYSPPRASSKKKDDEIDIEEIRKKEKEISDKEFEKFM